MHVCIFRNYLAGTMHTGRILNTIKGQGPEFYTKYHILHVFNTSTAFKENSSNHVKDLYKMELLTNFDVNMTSFLGRVPDYVLNL